MFEKRKGQRRATTDISDAARAATFGNIDQLLVDIDNVVDGIVDDDTGAVTFDKAGDARNYGVVDEIAGRALRSGAKVSGYARTTSRPEIARCDPEKPAITANGCKRAVWL